MSLHNQNYDTEQVSHEKHPRNVSLRSNWVHNPWQRVVIDKYENTIAKHCRKSSNLISKVKRIGPVLTLVFQVKQSPSSHTKNYNDSQNYRYLLKAYKILNISKTEANSNKAKNSQTQIVNAWVHLH